jgi:predicted HicB family RNase H-like nuclease
MSVQLNVRVQPKLLKRLQEAAKAEQRTVTMVVIRALERYISTSKG